MAGAVVCLVRNSMADHDARYQELCRRFLVIRAHHAANYRSLFWELSVKQIEQMAKEFGTNLKPTLLNIEGALSRQTRWRLST